MSQPSMRMTRLVLGVFTFLAHYYFQVIVFERAGLVFCFNFHPSKSLPDYRVGVDVAGEYQIVLDTDWAELGGHGIRDRQATSHTDNNSKGWHGRRTEMMVYLPSRTAAVWRRVGDIRI